MEAALTQGAGISQANSPARADAAASLGSLQGISVRPAVPERPSKFRLKVRRETPCRVGRLSHTDTGAAGCIPRIRAPAVDDVGQGAVLRQHIVEPACVTRSCD